MLLARRGAWWDARKIGLSPPLIETPQGWLMIYHGVRQTPSGALYRLGLALFDIGTPEKCLLRGEEWVFGPEAPYERVGDVGGVVFPCGAVVIDATLFVCFGCGDKHVGLATAELDELVDYLLTCPD